MIIEVYHPKLWQSYYIILNRT